MSDFLRSRLRSFGFAFSGLKYVLRTQKNAWIHFGISLAVIILGIWLGISASSWAIVLLTMGLVWTAECLNTAVESILDLVSPQHHPLAKIGKDVAAAAVLVSAISAILVGICIFGPSLLNLLFHS